MISSSCQTILDNLRSSELVEIHLDQLGKSLHLVFTFAGFVGGEGHDVVLQLHNIMYFDFSRVPNDNGGFLVGSLSINALGDGKTLPDLSSRYKTQDEALPVKDGRMFHLHIEGGISMEVVCTSFQVLKEVT